MWGILKKARDMDLAPTLGQAERNTKENGFRIKYMAKAYIYGLMVHHTKVIGWRRKNMVKGFLDGRMVRGMKDSILKIKKLVVSISIKMDVLLGP